MNESIVVLFPGWSLHRSRLQHHPVLARTSQRMWNRRRKSETFRFSYLYEMTVYIHVIWFRLAVDRQRCEGLQPSARVPVGPRQPRPGAGVRRHRGGRQLRGRVAARRPLLTSNCVWSFCDLASVLKQFSTFQQFVLLPNGVYKYRDWTNCSRLAQCLCQPNALFRVLLQNMFSNYLCCACAHPTDSVVGPTRLSTCSFYVLVFLQLGFTFSVLAWSCVWFCSRCCPRSSTVLLLECNTFSVA